MADVLVWSGDPFSVYSRVSEVFIDGRPAQEAARAFGYTLGAFHVMAIGGLKPMPRMRGMIAHPKTQTVFASYLGPRTDNVFFRPHVD